MLTLTAKATHLGQPDGPRNRSVICQFDEAGGLIGRSDYCDMVLPDPGQGVSREQARVFHADGQYFIANVSIANPMYVNGLELAPGFQQALAHGDELRMGTYVIAVVQVVQLVHASVDQPAEPPQTTVLSTPPMQADADSAWADPLAGLGGAGPEGAQSANPFADLLGGAVPIGQDNPKLNPNGQQGNSTTPSSTTHPDQTRPAQQPIVTTAPIGHRIDPVSAPPMPDPARSAGRPPQAEKIPEDYMERIQFDRTQGRAVADGAVWDSGNRGGRLSPLQQALFALPRPSSDANQPPGTWTPPLSGLAGAPFADLMGAPVQTHIARAPAASSASLRRTDYIPADFNPFALGGVAQRNTSDPLSLLASHGNGLSDVVPHRTIDTVYAPGTESPTALVVNPLEAARESALQVEQSTDPLKLFGDDAHALNPPQAVNTWSRNAGSLPDHALEITAYFRPPTARLDLTLIQEQIVDVGENAGVNAATPPPSVQPRAQPVPQSRVTSQSQLTITTTSSVFPVADREVATKNQGLTQQIAPDIYPPAPVMATMQKPTETAPPILQMMAPSPAPPGAASPVANGGAQAENAADALLEAFMHGAGLQDWQGATLTREWMETVGRMLQAAVQGTVSLLTARAAINPEMHLSATLIAPKDNNPLKFLPDAQTALTQMLIPRIPGLMAPVEAMREAFGELITHQTAIATGTHSALEALFWQFAPSTIESRNPRDGVSERISGALYGARLWNAYKTQYEAIRYEIMDDFFRGLESNSDESHDGYHDPDFYKQ